MQYWLMKSEPDVFSIDDLIKSPQQTAHWEGVRNYQARNMLRDQIKAGDQAFFYHSSCDTPGIVGIMDIAQQGYPDNTAFDPKAKYYDAKSHPEKPTWFMVDVHFVRKFKRPITLAELRLNPALAQFSLLKKGNRLSVIPVSPKEWQAILSMEL